MKFAIVDLGSNTIRLSVYNTLPEGGFDLLFSEKEMAGLVSYVHGGVLSPEGIQRACGAIRDFQALLRQFDLDAPTCLQPLPCGTSATRRRRWSRSGRPPAWEWM